MKHSAVSNLHRSVLAAAAFLLGCNSHLLVESRDPEVTVIDPPVVPPPTKPVDDAGLPTNPFEDPPLKDLPDGAVKKDAPQVNPGTDAAPLGPDAPVKPDLGPDVPPVETLTCPTGQVRIHVRDVWSSQVDPTMKTLTAPPTGVLIIDPKNSYQGYGARVDGADCTYYSVCIPSTVTTIQIKPIGADSCPSGNPSGNIDISSLTKNREIWLEYAGPSSTLQADYSAYPNANVGPDKFHLTSDPEKLVHAACKIGTPPDATIPTGYTKVHFRWPFSDPVKTGYPGSGCGDEKLGYSPPPYPSSLKVTGVGCEMQAVLEFQDGVCPWYYVMIPNTIWPTSGNTPKIVFRYPDDSKGLWTPDIPLPPRTANEYWIAYAGAPDNTPASIPRCMDWSQQSNTYFIYTANPGPGYQNCGGAVGPVDPCSPPQPNGYHTVHFRYLWAGQKTFTFFPNNDLMPPWMELEVNSPGNALKVICYREQDRPWYNCPVPDSSFKPGATWRGVDKTHDPEWNTVKPWPFPDKPGDYWIRWYYGKPDIPRDKDPPTFKVYDYYPDGTNGDWSATGDWNDSMCAPKPPTTPVKVGYDYGGWFPYKRTQYKYPYGASLSYVYPQDKRSDVQDLLDAFTFERYEIWKKNWVKYDAEACGAGTARVWSDIPLGTVSEGQGYGMAMSAAIGDKDLFDRLWNFVRHYRTQKKYCGLMGWMWSDSGDCRPIDHICDGTIMSCSGNGDSAFDGDVDIGIGLLYAALQWPEYTDAATDWFVRMECEVNTKYGDGYNYPTKGDTWNKNCQSGDKCDYDPGTSSEVFNDYYPPGYFRAFGDFLAEKLGGDAKASNGQSHRDFWYKTAETVYELVEKCYDQPGVHPGLIGNGGDIKTPCRDVGGGEPYEWGRALWRLGIDAAWFGDDTSLPENASNSSRHYGPKSRMQAKIDNSQAFYNDFYKKNPPEEHANRFSTLCHQLTPAGTVENCDPAYGHNSYTVNLAMCSYSSLFNAGGATTNDIRREALEESVSTTVQNDHYFQESLGVYSLLFLTGNFPNPMDVPR